MAGSSGALPWAPARTPLAIGVPPLTMLCLDALASKPEVIYDLGGTAEHLALELLYKVLAAGRLDYRLACVFRDSGHDCIAEAMRGIDLLAAVPTHNSIRKR